MKKIIVIDTSYTFSELKNRNSLNVIFARDLSNYFSKVISVHPLADLTQYINVNNESLYAVNTLNENHIFYEFITGNSSKSKILKSFLFFYFQIKMIKKLYKIIKEENINYIKSGDVLYAGLIAFILSKLTKVKYYVRVGSNNNKIREVTRKPMQKKFYKYIFIEKFFENLIVKNATHLFPANEDNLNFIKCYQISKRKMTIIRYGPLINKKHYIDPLKRKINIPEIINIRKKNIPVLLCIARLEKEKLVNDVLEVFKKLVNIESNLLLYIVGDGSLKSQLINQIKEYKLEEKVFIKNNKTQDWIYEIISISSLVISPHTGRALCEAALAGSLIVAYDIDWQKEIIINKKTGFLVEYKNIKKLFEVSKKIILSKQKYEYLGVNLRKMAVELLDTQKTINDEINVYNNS